MTISEKDKYLLTGLLGVLFLIIAWFFIVSPLREKTDSIKMENIQLKSTAETYQAVYSRKEEYEQGVLTLQDTQQTIIDKYPVNISREDEIMFLANLENYFPEDVAVESITMSDVEEVVPESTMNDAAIIAENTDATENEQAEQAADTTAPATDGTDVQDVLPHLYKMPVNFSFRCTYAGAKDMIAYLYQQGDTKSIENISLAFDTESGNLTGSMDLNLFYLLGIDKDYQSITIPAMPKGVSDIFHTVKSGAGIHATQKNETTPVDETKETDNE